jgi:type VII secretion-associated serine protease mycosin
MRRIAAALLGLALVAAAQLGRAPGASAAGTPSPTASPTPTPTAQPKPQPPAIPVPAPAAPRPTRDCPVNEASPRITAVPWAQKVLDFRSVWPLAKGQGVTVAVVDSGVDFTPQLAGKVTAMDLTGTGPQDCVGHGTEVAAIIAARDIRAQGMPFAGVAPRASIMSVKVNSQDTGRSIILAKGIHDAAFRGAKVINVSITTGSTPALRAAVAYAQSQDAVVVAAGGNDGTATGQGPFYPASYPGVLSVGAVGSDGGLAPFSDQRSHVAVTAPGVNVASAWPWGYHTELDGTSFATAFVSGVAALVRSRYPRLSAAQVVARIKATADGGAGPGTGSGLVNPLQAVTALLAPGTAPSPAPAPQAVSVSRLPPQDRRARSAALTITLGSLGGAVLVVLGALVIGPGRRRRWRAQQARVPDRGGWP